MQPGSAASELQTRSNESRYSNSRVREYPVPMLSLTFQVTPKQLSARLHKVQAYCIA